MILRSSGIYRTIPYLRLAGPASATFQQVTPRCSLFAHQLTTCTCLQIVAIRSSRTKELHAFLTELLPGDQLPTEVPTYVLPAILLQAAETFCRAADTTSDATELLRAMAVFDKMAILNIVPEVRTILMVPSLADHLVIRGLVTRTC